jgi:hypothetical protein
MSRMLARTAKELPVQKRPKSSPLNHVLHHDVDQNLKLQGGASSDEAAMLTQRLKTTGAIIGVGRNRLRVARAIFTRHGVALSESVRRAALSLAVDREEDWEVVGSGADGGGVNGPLGVVILDDGMQASFQGIVEGVAFVRFDQIEIEMGGSSITDIMKTLVDMLLIDLFEKNVFLTWV